LSPRPRTHKRKKISSVVGLTTLRKWQKDKTPLCFISFEFSDVFSLIDVRVNTVTSEKLELLAELLPDPIIPVDLRGMKFWELEPEDIPVSDLDLAAFVRFLGMRRSDEDVPLLLVEKAIVH
jgi:hypothetical protein